MEKGRIGVGFNWMVEVVLDLLSYDRLSSLDSSLFFFLEQTYWGVLDYNCFSHFVPELNFFKVSATALHSVATHSIAVYVF